MKTQSKALLLALCAVLLVASTVFGTLAYLTDTHSATNTFTVGQVGIDLSEADVDKDGNPLKDDKTTDEAGNKITRETADRLKASEAAAGQSVGNAYHLIPNHEYTKDPMVTIDPDSEVSYIRMLVTVTINGAVDAKTDLGSIITGYQEAVWPRNGAPVIETTTDTEGNTTKTTVKYEYRYKETVGNDTEVAQDLEPLFTGIKVPAELTNETLAVFAGMNIDIEAHAIQADGFADADAAWAAFSK